MKAISSSIFSFNNTARDIQPENSLNRTPHGTPTTVNFALLHIFGYQFAPRLQGYLLDKARHFTHRNSGHPSPLRRRDHQSPVRKIRASDIIRDWEECRRIFRITGAKRKPTTEQQIVRKLSAPMPANKPNQVRPLLGNIEQAFTEAFTCFNYNRTHRNCGSNVQKSP